MVGMSVGKSLEPIKDEVDVDTVVKAMKTVMSGGEPLLDDEQAQQVAQAFDKRLQAQQQEEQARQMAERQAQPKTKASAGTGLHAQLARASVWDKGVRSAVKYGEAGRIK